MIVDLMIFVVGMCFGAMLMATVASLWINR